MAAGCVFIDGLSALAAASMWRASRGVTATCARANAWLQSGCPHSHTPSTSSTARPAVGALPSYPAGAVAGHACIDVVGGFGRRYLGRLAAASSQARCSATLPAALTSKDLDEWAKGPSVQGHAHSRPSREPYSPSPCREIGGGSKVPADWGVKLLSTAGQKSADCANQDAFSYTVLDSAWMVCIACDGHGENGEVVAERVARTLPMFFERNLQTVRNAGEALTNSFEEAQADLEQSFKVVQVYSGATAVACCVNLETLETWVAHAGDSLVVIGDLEDGSVVFKAEGHKAHSPSEEKRLKAAGAQIVSKQYDDGDIVSRIFIPRTGVPGLAMSRSLGDGCLKKYGVTAEPDVHEVTGLWRSCQKPAILLASDGLWDTFTAEETVRALAARAHAGLDPIRGVEALVKRAQRRWIEAEGDYCDDVTVLLMAPRSSLSRPAKAKT